MTDETCPNCGIDLKRIFGDVADEPRSYTFICAETAEITVVESEPWEGAARCFCGVDLPAPKR